MALLALALINAGATGYAQGDESGKARLPEGRRGIAVKYAGDRGIERDPAVIFVETFEADTIDAIAKRWESVRNREILSLSSDVPEGSAGGTSLLMTHVGGEGDGAHLYRRLEPGHEQVFARFYVKFDPDCAPIQGLVR